MAWLSFPHWQSFAPGGERSPNGSHMPSSNLPEKPLHGGAWHTSDTSTNDLASSTGLGLYASYSSRASSINGARTSCGLLLRRCPRFPSEPRSVAGSAPSTYNTKCTLFCCDSKIRISLWRFKHGLITQRNWARKQRRERTASSRRLGK